MTPDEIRDAFLDAFSQSSQKELLLSTLRQLKQRAEEADLATWVDIIAARIAVAEDRPADALPLVDAALGREPENPYALLIRARALSDIPERRQEAIGAHEELIRQLEGADALPECHISAIVMLN